MLYKAHVHLSICLSLYPAFTPNNLSFFSSGNLFKKCFPFDCLSMHLQKCALFLSSLFKWVESSAFQVFIYNTKIGELSGHLFVRQIHRDIWLIFWQKNVRKILCMAVCKLQWQIIKGNTHLLNMHDNKSDLRVSFEKPDSYKIDPYFLFLKASVCDVVPDRKCFISSVFLQTMTAGVRLPVTTAKVSSIKSKSISWLGEAVDYQLSW